MAKFISQSVKVLSFPENPVRSIAHPARVCYKSLPKDFVQEKNFVQSLLRSGHMTPFEHVSATVELVTSRAVTHELVRHRLASFNQESQRYVKYDTGIEFIRPIWTYRPENNRGFVRWCRSMTEAETAYGELLDLGHAPEEAREVLPNSTATSIVVTANFREWLHIFDLRLFGKTGRPLPAIKALMFTVWKEFSYCAPEIFHPDIQLVEGHDTVSVG